MKTETEKAIETLETESWFYKEELKDLNPNDDIEVQTIERNKELIVEYKQIIILLQQGEKYKKLISHLKDLYDAEMPTTKVLTPYKMIEYLEQKYFPKELPDEKTTKL